MPTFPIFAGGQRRGSSLGSSPYIGGNTFSGRSSDGGLFGMSPTVMMALAGMVGGLILQRKMNQRRALARQPQQPEAPQEVAPVPALWNAEKNPDPDQEDAANYSLDEDGNLGLTHDVLRRRVASRFLGQDRYA